MYRYPNISRSTEVKLRHQPQPPSPSPCRGCGVGLGNCMRGRVGVMIRRHFHIGSFRVRESSSIPHLRNFPPSGPEQGQAVIKAMLAVYNDACPPPFQLSHLLRFSAVAASDLRYSHPPVGSKSPLRLLVIELITRIQFPCLKEWKFQAAFREHARPTRTPFLRGLRPPRTILPDARHQRHENIHTMHEPCEKLHTLPHNLEPEPRVRQGGIWSLQGQSVQTE